MQREQSCIRVSRVSEWVKQRREGGSEEDREEGRKDGREWESARAIEWVSGRVGREWAMVDLIVGVSEHVITFVTDWKSMNDWPSKWIIIYL